MRRVEAILRYIADTFSRPVTVTDIARAVSQSASRATAPFREVMGVSIKHHLTGTRLNDARMLLTETDDKIVSIARDSGFRSQSSFYTAFTEPMASRRRNTARTVTATDRCERGSRSCAQGFDLPPIAEPRASVNSPPQDQGGLPQ